MIKDILFWKSLRFKMPAIVLFGIIPPLLGAIFYSSYHADREFHHHAEEDMAYHAKLLFNTVSWWDQINVLSLKQLSQQPDIVGIDTKRQELVLNSLVNTNPNLYLAAIVNLDGWSVARSDANTPQYYGDRLWFLGAKVGKGVSYQTLISSTIGKPSVCMGIPIRNERSEIAKVGKLCTELSTLAEQIDQLRFGKTGYAILVDETGQILAHPNSALISGTKLYNLAQYPPVKNILEGRDGFFSFVNEKGIKWVSYGISVENGWKIAIVQQKDEFLQNEEEFRNFSYLVALVAVIAVSALTWLLANYLIRPIGQLTKAAEAISKGKLDRKVEIKRRDELGILARSFNQMASRLKISFKELESRVGQRTSELKIAKEMAENANQTKDKFLARISHELRSPLNTIINYAAILEETPNLISDRAESTKGLSIIRESGIHLLKLIEDILDFSKAKVSKIELNPNYLHWQSFLEEIVAMVELSTQEKQLMLEYETVGHFTTGIWVDRKRLQQVLINLLNNAIKFTEQGKVTLKVSVLNPTEVFTTTSPYPQQEFRFEVIDTGMGISSEHLEKIFQPFEQVSTAEQQINGTGLGLSISKQLVAMMGGQLKVKSKLGAGSTFWFDISLPVVNLIPEAEENGEAKALSPDNLRPKILIVDDQEENYFWLTNRLTPLGFKVFSAVNGQQALEIAALVQPDLILLDLFMPVKTGFTLVRDLQKMPQFKAIPIILSSSCDYESLKAASQRYDCQGFLTKPIDENKLLALLEKYEMLSMHKWETVSNNSTNL